MIYFTFILIRIQPNVVIVPTVNNFKLYFFKLKVLAFRPDYALNNYYFTLFYFSYMCSINYLKLNCVFVIITLSHILLINFVRRIIFLHTCFTHWFFKCFFHSILIEFVYREWKHVLQLIN